MTAAVASTLPVENAWFQPPERRTPPEFSIIAADFKSRIQSTLEADSFSRKIAETATQSEREDTKISENRRTAIIRAIDRAIISAFPSTAPAPTLSLEALQEWEGYVTAIGDEIFRGRLIDLTAGRKIEEEEADFPICDLSDDDRELLEMGAVFRWIIGYQRAKGGTKRRVSQVTFRRLPAWTRKDLMQAKETAAELSHEISWK